jgi:hypothetical protein
MNKFSFEGNTQHKITKESKRDKDSEFEARGLFL